MKQVKLTGPRSIQTKLRRLAYELENDASRIRADHPERPALANGIKEVSSRLGDMARSLDR